MKFAVFIKWSHLCLLKGPKWPPLSEPSKLFPGFSIKFGATARIWVRLGTKFSVKGPSIRVSIKWNFMVSIEGQCHNYGHSEDL